jgi:GMC oxidoreductase
MLCEQVDKRRDWRSLRRAAPYDLPPQRDTSEPPRFHWHTCEARHIRRVRLACFPFSLFFFFFSISGSDNRATGVAFTFNPLFHPDGPTETRTVRGTKLVVLCAGSFGTPGILERSGIGGKTILEGVGVKQRVDLPGVGENYQGPFLLRDRCRGLPCF